METNIPSDWGRGNIRRAGPEHKANRKSFYKANKLIDDD